LILAAIEATNDDVSGVDTLAEIQALVASVRNTQAAALAVIRDYDGNNTQPMLTTFANAGLTGVTLINLDGINEYLATMTAAQTDTFAEVQALIDAYNALSPGCDGLDNDNVTLTLAQWHALGYVDITTAAEVAELNDLFDTEDWLVTGSVTATAALVADVIERLRPVPVQPRAAVEPAGDAGSVLAAPTATPSVSPTPAPAAPVASAPVTPKPTAIPVAKPVYPQAPKPGVGIQEVGPGQAQAVVNGEPDSTIIRTLDDVTMQVEVRQEVVVDLLSITTDGQPAQLAESGSLIIHAGGVVVINGVGYKPGTEIDIWLYSTPTRLGTLVADENGAFDASFTIPNSIPAGEHTIKIDGISKSGKLTTVSVGVLVIEPEVASNGVDTGQPVDGDSTGISAQTVAVLGGIVVMLLLVGAGLLVSARRRRRSE